MLDRIEQAVGERGGLLPRSKFKSEAKERLDRGIEQIPGELDLDPEDPAGRAELNNPAAARGVLPAEGGNGKIIYGEAKRGELDPDLPELPEIGQGHQRVCQCVREF